MPIATPSTVAGQLENGNAQSFHAKSEGVNGTNNGVTSGSSIIQEILARRATAGKLIAGIAAASDSDMFKGSVSCSNSQEFFFFFFLYNEREKTAY